MAEKYERVATTHANKPSALPLDKRSRRVVVQPVRLARNPRGQNRTGRGNPYK